MTDKPDRARIYDEKAVSAILKRASQLQAKSNEDGGFGLSLTELKQIGVGLSAGAGVLRTARGGGPGPQKAPISSASPGFCR